MLLSRPVHFNVAWNNGVEISIGENYIPDGSELKIPYEGDRGFTQNRDQTILVDGTPRTVNAIVMTDSKGGGYTYYKLRDLGELIGFSVGWSAERGIYIETEPTS